MSNKFQVIRIMRNHVGAFPLEFYEDKALLYSRQHKAIFKRTISQNPKKRGIVAIRNGSRVIYRSFFSEAPFHLRTDQIGLNLPSLSELGLSRNGLGEVEVSRGNRFQFYYSHPNSAIRMPFKIGLYSILLAILALVPAFLSFIDHTSGQLSNLYGGAKAVLIMTPYLDILFWIVALLASVLYGFNAIRIFVPDVDEKDKSKQAWRWHQRWLNFLGSVVGWLSLWLIVRKFYPTLFQDLHAEISLWDVVGAFIAFIGVTGYLPYTVVTIVSGVGSLVGRLAELVASMMSKPR